MKYARYSESGRQRVGIVDTEASVLRPMDGRIDNMIDLIKEHPNHARNKQEAGPPIALDRIKLDAPIIPARNIFCVGKNYRAHAREFSRSGYEAGAVKGAEIDEYPAVFTKPTTAIIGPSDV